MWLIGKKRYLTKCSSSSSSLPLCLPPLPAPCASSSRYKPTICLASFLSKSSSTVSSTRYNKSNLEIKVGGRSIFLVMGKSGLYFELTGLAAARIEVRAFRVVIILALAIDTVCCSFSGGVRKVWKALLDLLTITSCKALLVASDILSNSSMQQTPPSLSTSAPLDDVLY